MTTALRETLAEQLFRLYAQPFGIDTWEGQPTTWETLQESLREEFRSNADDLLASGVAVRFVADPTALREAACVCEHAASDHDVEGCMFCACLLGWADVLLTSGVVQSREDVVRKAKAEALRGVLSFMQAQRHSPASSLSVWLRGCIDRLTDTGTSKKEQVHG